MSPAEAPAVEVRIDDRLRLAGALLAASAWPEHEQARKAYKPHRVAEGARRYFGPHQPHPAVQAAMAGLMIAPGDAPPGQRADAPPGQRADAPPGRLYGMALAGAWPEALLAEVDDFSAVARVEVYWQETQADWNTAAHELNSVLARAALPGFLSDLFGPPLPRLSAYPNLLYPGREALVVAGADEWVVCQPPPPAWGTSPPWRYSDRPDEVLASVAQALAAALFERVLPPNLAVLGQLSPMFGVAAAGLFLSETEGQAAGDQYVVLEKKVRGLPMLPAVVEVVQRALAGRRVGQFASAADYAAQLLVFID